MSKKIKLGDKFVGGNEPVYIIAEGGLTNWGKLELAKKQVDVAVEAGCDAIKFQAQTTEDLVSRKESPYWYDRLKYKELSHDELSELWKYCENRKIQCLITAHVESDLKFLDEILNVPFLKIGSGESMNYDFLNKVGVIRKPVIVSLGLHISDEEINKTIKALEDAGTTEIVIMHCNTVYPTPLDVNNLGQIKKLESMFGYPVGYSDHTEGYHIPLAAVALGAKVVEKHISFDKNDERSLDCIVSCLPDELKFMVKQMREIEKTLVYDKERRNNLIQEARGWAKQSLTSKIYIPKGTIITRDMIILKRPGTGLGLEEIDNVIGKTTNKDIEEDTFIKLEDLT